MALPHPAAPARTVALLGRRYALRPPSVRDPRVHVAATITTLHVLGQVRFGFAVSVAQILVALGTCGGAELVVRFVRDQELAWPASGLLAGNGIAFLLRVEGTPVGEPWSLHGAWVFAATGAVAVAARYLVRVGGRPLWNPSNVALVACFLALGTERVNPLDLWWAPWSAPMALAYVVLAVGGVAVTWRTGMWPVTLAFLLVFTVANGAVARTGHCMAARWNVGPVCDLHWWWVLTSSPEVLLFACFMVTDPRTAPRGRVARVVHGGLVALLASALASMQSTEFATKVAILGSLVVVCALRPALEVFAPAAGSAGDHLGRWLAQHRDGSRPALGALRCATATMAAITAVLTLSATGTEYGDALRPLDPVAEEAVAAARATVSLPAVAVDAQLAAEGRAIDGAQAEAMARDVLAACRALDDAIDGRDLTTVRALVSRRHLAAVGHRFGSGQTDDYRFDELTVGIRRGVDPQAPPQLVVRGVGVRGDGTPVAREFAVAEVDGRWVVDGDDDAAGPGATR